MQKKCQYIINRPSGSWHSVCSVTFSIISKMASGWLAGDFHHALIELSCYFKWKRKKTRELSRKTLTFSDYFRVPHPVCCTVLRLFVRVHRCSLQGASSTWSHAVTRWPTPINLRGKKRKYTCVWCIYRWIHGVNEFNEEENGLSSQIKHYL